MLDPILISRVIFIVAIFYLTYGLVKIAIRSFSLHVFFYLMASTAMLSYMSIATWAGDSSQLLPTETIALVLEWIRISGIAFLLTGLAVMVRLAKPKITQAPLILSLLPLLLLGAHPFVIHTLVLKDVLVNMYLTGAIVIGLLMYGLKTYSNGVYATILFGILLAAGMFSLSNTYYIHMTYTIVIYYLILSFAAFIIKNGLERAELHELQLKSNHT